MVGNGSPRKSKKQSLNLKLPFKALSANKMYAGMKRRSVYYKRFAREVTEYLDENYDKYVSLKGNLRLKMEVGVSSKLMDVSNTIKAIEDVIVKWCGTFDDRQIYSLNIEKWIVRKGDEYMNLSITKLRQDRDKR